MKKYKIELTENQLSKLEIFIITYAEKALNSSKIYKELSNEEGWDKSVKEKFTSNSKWYEEQYKELVKIKEIISNVPF